MSNRIILHDIFKKNLEDLYQCKYENEYLTIVNLTFDLAKNPTKGNIVENRYEYRMIDIPNIKYHKLYYFYKDKKVMFYRILNNSPIA